MERLCCLLVTSDMTRGDSGDLTISLLRDQLFKEIVIGGKP